MSIFTANFFRCGIIDNLLFVEKSFGCVDPEVAQKENAVVRRGKSFCPDCLFAYSVLSHYKDYIIVEMK